MSNEYYVIKKDGPYERMKQRENKNETEKK